MGSLQSSIDARPGLFHCQKSMLDLVSLADISQAEGVGSSIIAIP